MKTTPIILLWVTLSHGALSIYNCIKWTKREFIDGKVYEKIVDDNVQPHNPRIKANEVEDVLDSPPFPVKMCALILLRANTDWLSTSILHTYFNNEDKSYKLIIDSRICKNLVPKSTFQRMIFVAKTHISHIKLQR